MRPQNREEFRTYCLGRLGAPVIDVNVSLEQIDDRIDDALDRFYDYHFDGVEETSYLYNIQDVDITNGWIPLDPKIFSVVSVYPFVSSSFLSGTDLFSAQYQFFLNDFYVTPGVATGNIQYYDMLRSYTDTIQKELAPVKSFHFNRKTSKVFFTENLTTIQEKAPSLLFKVYTKIDIDTYPAVWDDRWLKSYATACIKKQWGSNISKFGNVNLPGGITLNGAEIYSQAVDEMTVLEDQLMNDMQLPIDFSIG
jgi:hypothetical protein